VKRKWSSGVRVAIHRMVEVAGFRVRLARISTTKTWMGTWIDDTLWLAGTDRIAKDLEDITRDHLPPWMAALIEQLEVSADTGHSVRSTSSAFSLVGIGDVDVRMRQLSTTTDGQRLSLLPKSLTEKAADLPYWLRPSKDGLDFSDRGIEKFWGCGMSKTHHNVDVLEFSTYYVLSEKDQKSHVKRTMELLLGEGPQFAEFITQYDPKLKTLTIFKLFLNGVLPPGQNAGVKATAEQLLSIQVQTVFDEAWNGVSVIRGLKAVWLCDVVNWNSYCLLSMVGRETSSDTEEWMLTEECKASKISRQALKDGTVRGVFPRTVLGKVVCRILDYWREKGVADFEVDEVNIIWNTAGQIEFIYGEFRRMMDVEVKLKLVGEAEVR